MHRSSWWIGAAAAINVVSAAIAEPFDWLRAPEQRTAASHVAAAYAHTSICSTTVDRDVAMRMIRDRIAGGGALEPEMAADLMQLVIAIQASQVKVRKLDEMSSKQLTSYCAEILGAYGPGGTVMPGILAP